MTESRYDAPPPAEEPKGYRAVRSFVKSRAENNEYYIAQYADHPWFEIIQRTHEELQKIVPNYNIAQIKEKFGGLRYYCDYPEGTSQEAYDKAEKLILCAEYWVAGYETAIREIDDNK